jgi:hypothetical protein
MIRSACGESGPAAGVPSGEGLAVGDEVADGAGELEGPAVAVADGEPFATAVLVGEGSRVLAEQPARSSRTAARAATRRRLMPSA